MANINPIGIDQSSGQIKAISPTDSVVDNIGSQIGIYNLNCGDYSGPVIINGVSYPVTSPALLAFPSTGTAVPISAYVGWSSNSEFLAVAADTDGIFLYQRVGTTLYKIANPASLPARPYGVAWSKDSNFLAITTIGSTGAIYVYQRSGASFTLIAQPASTPNTITAGADFSYSGEFLVLGAESPTNIFIYQRNNSAFTKMSDPASLPPGIVGSVSWSPDNKFFAVTVGGGILQIYQRTGPTSFSLTSEPASFPLTGATNTAKFSPDGKFLVSGIGGTPPFFLIYQVEGSTFTLLADPATSGSTAPVDISWTADSQYLALAYGGSGESFVIYQRSGTTFTRLANVASQPVNGGGASVGYSSAFTNDGQFLAFTMGGRKLHLYQTSSTLPDKGIVIIN